MTQHTPTPPPWKVTDIPSVDLWGKQSNHATVSSSAGNTIAVIGQNSAADAAFIVRAVNAHEELLTALQYAQNHLEKLEGDGIEVNKNVMDMIKAARQTAEL